MFALGRERTIEQDPAFSLRILVDIAIRALSPAVNDPTTAVQVLDYIEDLPLVIGRHDLHGHGEVVMGRPGPGRWSQCAATAKLRRQRRPVAGRRQRPSERRRAHAVIHPIGMMLQGRRPDSMKRSEGGRAAAARLQGGVAWRT
jgi:hypothetical protein